MATNFSPKVAENFSCYFCDYTCSKQSDYTKHVLTSKHKRTTKDYKFIAEIAEIKPKQHRCEYCDKTYNHHSSLWKHSKKCVRTTSEVLVEDPKNSCFVMQLLQQNNVLQNQILELCKNNNTNITNNLNLFLNEECKDAMNIMDFVDSLQLQFSDLENVGRLGFVNGISDIIIKNLKALDIHKRPVHCTDLKREVMYVKDEDQWNKEADDNMKIRKAIKCIAQKNTKNLILFKQKHPDCLQGDSRSSDQYNKLVREAFGGGSDKDDTTSENKIISRLSKEVKIDKD